ncbi:MAG: hypothetical protein K0S32_2172 [Bacteroidetes bacterium]|jgi:phosphoribosylglycinamide formyltransferase-1|nr:hypothetical protein [Bacteroidota bacterium]
MSSGENKKFGFYVSGNASRLLLILDQCPLLIADTCVVVNDNGPNPDLARILEEKKIDYIEFNYKEKQLKGKLQNEYVSSVLLVKFLEHQVDYCFSFGSRLLSGELLNTYHNKIINFHPAILPMFPGVKAIDQALNSSSFLLGNTAHFIDSGMDTGPVIMQAILHNKSFATYEDILGLQIPMINQIYHWISENRITIENNKVHIVNAGYPAVQFYPLIEIKH